MKKIEDIEDEEDIEMITENKSMKRQGSDKKTEENKKKKN